MIQLKPGTPLDAEKLRRAIRAAGYETRETEVTVRARVEKAENGFALRPHGVRQSFAVPGEKDRAKLEGLDGQTVVARGRLLEGEKPALELLEVTQPGG